MNRLRRIAVLALAVSGCSRSRTVPLVPAPTPPTVFTEDDREAVVNQTLARALTGSNLPDLSFLLRQAPPILLSNENIGDDRRDAPGLAIEVMPFVDIQRQADRSGRPSLFLQFKPLEIVNGDTVIVSLDNNWVVPTGQTIGILSGGGITIRYTRGAGDWVGEFIGLWVA